MARKKFKKCILHIGSGKTGTTSIQRSFAMHRDELEEGGYLYPGYHPRHCFLEGFFSKKPHKKQFYKHRYPTKKLAEAQVQSRMDELELAISKSAAHTIIFSNETFHTMPKKNIQKMADFLYSIADEVTVYCYIRDPLSQSASLIQQLVKGGDFTLEQIKKPYMFRAKKSLSKYVSVFNASNIRVCEFTRSQLHRSDVVADLCKHIDMPDSLIDLLLSNPQSLSNEAITIEGMQLASAVTQAYPKYIKGVRNEQRARFVNYNRISGKKYTLPKSMYGIVMRRRMIDVQYLSNKFNFAFTKEPDAYLEPSDTMWDEGTIKSIALYINDLERDIDALKRSKAPERVDRLFNAMRQFFEETLNNAPLNIDAFEGLLLLYLRWGYRKELFAVVENHVAKTSRSPKFQFKIAQKLIKHNLKEEAETVLKNIKTLNPWLRSKIKGKLSLNSS